MTLILHWGAASAITHYCVPSMYTKYIVLEKKKKEKKKLYLLHFIHRPEFLPRVKKPVSHQPEMIHQRHTVST